MNYIGIDPGLTGAVAIIGSSDIVFSDIPILNVLTGKKNKPEYNIAEMVRMIKEIIKNDQRSFCVGIEKVHAMPKQGVTSSFNFGKGYGIWLGIISAFEIPYTLITPRAWKKVMMEGMGKEKDASRLRAIQLFPQCAQELNLKKHHGRADALLIAEYLKNKNQFGDRK